MPPPPARFSTITGCPRRRDSSCAAVRARMSVKRPAAEGQIRRTGRLGYSWADTGAAMIRASAAVAARNVFLNACMLGSRFLVLASGRRRWAVGSVRRLLEPAAAVDDQVRAGDVIGKIRRQEDGGVGNVGLAAPAAQ